MPTDTKLWIAYTLVAPELADLFAEVLGEVALAVTVLAPPRIALARVEAIFGDPQEAASMNAPLAIAAMMHKVPAPVLQIEEAPKLDWLKKVAEDFPPLSIGRWTIHGAQHRDLVPNRRHALQIDATNAFGTGEHPTTRGCLLMLESFLKKGSLGRNKNFRMLDMGCGSGILAMAFAKARGGLSVGVDFDADSIVTACENRNGNGLRKNIRFDRGCGYKRVSVRRHAPYDLIMSNIFARPLSLMAKDLKNNLRDGGMVILAGLLTSQANGVLSAHRRQGLYLVKQMRLGEWSILALKHRKGA